MTEEKRKRGRPKKVKLDEGNAPKIQTFAPIYPSDTPINDPVSLDLPALVREAELASGVSKKGAVVSQGLHQKQTPTYDPYSNPRFKSKNNLK